MTPEKTKHIRPVNSISAQHLLKINQDNATHYINSLLKTSKVSEVHEVPWFPIPQNPVNQREHMPM